MINNDLVLKDVCYDLVIIGGGSAGLASAISAYDNGVKNIILLEKENYLGGILNQCVHNGFGLHHFKEELTGPEYAERYINDLKLRNIEYSLNSMVTKINADLSLEYSSTDGYHLIKTKAIICATGCSERTRGAIQTDGDRPSGVMTAGLAQRYLNIDGYLVGKKVFILGSGDIGLIMARRMTLEGAKVLGVAEIMPYSNGLNRNIVQCLNDFDIPLYLSHTVKQIIGKERLEKIVVCKVDDKMQFVPNSEKEFEVDTLLLSVGLLPNNPLLQPLGVKIHPKTKGPVVDNFLQTSVPGIFACGNNLHVHDLVDFVSNEGYFAGLNASKFIKGELNATGEKVLLESRDGIGYVLPSSLYLTDDEKSKINFRVTKPYYNAHLILKLNGKVIKKIRKQYLLPAEMGEIILDNNMLEPGILSVEVADE